MNIEMNKQMVHFDGEKFQADIKKRVKNFTKAVEQCNLAASTVVHNIDAGVINFRRLKIMCDHYGLNIDDYIIKDEPEASEDQAKQQEEQSTPDASELADALVDVCTELSQIRSVLSDISFGIKAMHPVFSSVEKCILILDAMTQYGACQYKNFDGKCKSEKIDDNAISMAMNISGCRVTMSNGVKWITRN